MKIVFKSEPIISLCVDKTWLFMIDNKYGCYMKI